MAQINFSPESIKEFAEKMVNSEKGIRTILAGLDKDVKEVEPHWSGDSHQQFARFYQDWRKGMDLHLNAIAKTKDKLREMAEKYPDM
jgi:WXG100 family type VII secretion target